MRIILIGAEQNLKKLFDLIDFSELDVAGLVMGSLPLGANHQINVEGRFYRGFSYEHLSQCLDELSFDYIFLTDHVADVSRVLRRLGVPAAQVLDFSQVVSDGFYEKLALFNLAVHTAGVANCLLTGGAAALAALDTARFALPTVNAAMEGQDLYYSFALAKRFLTSESHNFRYAIIALLPHSFHYTVSNGMYTEGGMCCPIIYSQETRRLCRQRITFGLACASKPRCNSPPRTAA